MDYRAMNRMTSHTFRRLCSLLLSLSILTPLDSVSTTLYKSRATDGTVLFADAPVQNGRVIRRSYNNSYGREMSTSSCLELSHRQLEERGNNFQALFFSVAQQQQVNPWLIRAIARVESCFDPRAVSVAGAQGLMQLMPATGRELGVRDAFDAAQNLSGGAAYIAQMLERFNNDQQLALAAYNAGPGAVERFGGIPPYRETRRYVDSVLKLYRRYMKNSSNASASATTLTK
jgi:soluble lytic murein transglycosylase-like protein